MACGEKDRVHSKCAICIVHSLHDAYSFIKSLQHRGREACGIFAIGDKIDVIKWSGNVSKVDLFDLHKILPAQNYHTFGAHVRYATQGREDKILEDAHPHFIGGKVDNRGSHIIIRDCDAAIIHNGQVNFNGINCNGNTSECDTKLLLKYYLKNGEQELMKKIPGSYTLAIAQKGRKEVIVMRDSRGVKPGCLGLKDGKFCVASEDVAFRENGAKFIEDLEPGSIYYISNNGGYRKQKILEPRVKHCFFEWNYVADVQSIMSGVSVLKMREELGKALANEFNPSDVDIITYLPRCPEVAARSYAKAIGKESKFMPLFYKLRGERAFQGTTKEDRNKSIRSNLHLIPQMAEKIKGKVVICIDDSTIRGNNAKYAREILYEAGVKKVYYLNYTPKIGIIGKDSIPRGCMFGVDMPPNDEFIVRTEDMKANASNEEINRKLGMTVYFLSTEGMFRAFERAGIKHENLCWYCIGGDNPFR